MQKFLFVLLVGAAILLTISCKKNEATTTPIPETALFGTWVRMDDSPGRQPADTLYFGRRNGRNLLSFYCDGSPGPNWPSDAETEYTFQNERLSYKDYTGNSSGDFLVDSFQWHEKDKEFSVKLRHLLLYMAADYAVIYRKVK